MGGVLFLAAAVRSREKAGWNGGDAGIGPGDFVEAGRWVSEGGNFRRVLTDSFVRFSQIEQMFEFFS